MHIYVDLDGTLADFDKHYENLFGVKPDKKTENVDWGKIKNYPNFYEGIPPMRDMRMLWSFLMRCVKNPIVLTGIPNPDIKEAPANKKAWVRKHLGAGVEVICTRSREKHKECKPGDILIDDWTKYRHLWEDAGGIWVTHTSAEDTVKQLTKLIRERRCPWLG
jgi:hypothetical protein